MQPSYEEQKEKFSIIKKKPHHVPPHLHNAIELVYVTQGELELGVGYELYHMEKGDFAIVFPDLIHHYQVFSKGRERGVPVLCLSGIKWSVHVTSSEEMSGKPGDCQGRIA